MVLLVHNACEELDSEVGVRPEDACSLDVLKLQISFSSSIVGVAEKRCVRCTLSLLVLKVPVLCEVADTSLVCGSIRVKVREMSISIRCRKSEECFATNLRLLIQFLVLCRMPIPSFEVVGYMFKVLYSIVFCSTGIPSDNVSNVIPRAHVMYNAMFVILTIGVIDLVDSHWEVNVRG